MSGVLVVDKPVGLTSARAVAIVKRRAGGVRTGHAGTLDPLATGVLVIALGKATKIIERLMNTSKRYRTAIDLSAFTTTDDAEGERLDVERAGGVGGVGCVGGPPTREDVERALAGFAGRIMQQPPSYSAMKVGGRRAYRLSRQGQPPHLAARAVVVHSIALSRYDWPIAEVDLHCGKGFYVRSLARDLGKALGTGGFCASLRRTAVGPFDESMAVGLEALPERITAGDVISIERALAMVDAAC